MSKLTTTLLLVGIYLLVLGSFWTAWESHIANLGVLGMQNIGEELHHEAEMEHKR